MDLGMCGKIIVKLILKK